MTTLMLEEEMPLFTVGDMARDLSGQLLSDGLPVDLTQAESVEAHILRSDGKVLSKTISNGDVNGRWSVSWADGDLNKRGNWQVEVQVTWVGGKPQTWPPAPFKVRDQFA